MNHFYFRMLLAFELLSITVGFSQSVPTEQLRTNLYAINADGTISLNDGDLILYSAAYNNSVDGSDARKITNPAENIGMLRGETTLAIEKRHLIGSSDTIFYKLWQMKKKSYKLEIVADKLDHPGLHGSIEDAWLNTSTPINLNDTTIIDFSVTNDAASSAPDRFRIIFNSVEFSPLPVGFTSLTAFDKSDGITVQWKTESEAGIKSYDVQRSSDGQMFSTSATIPSKENNKNASYEILDVHAFTGDNFYRIKSININGKEEYSKIIKIHRGITMQQVSVYPNPVTNGLINLEITGAVKGEYKMSIISKQGQTMLSQKLQYQEGNNTHSVQLNKSIKGTYLIEIITPENKKVTRHLFFQ